MGSGVPIGNVARGEPGFKERIDFGEVIGQWSDRTTGETDPRVCGHSPLRVARYSHSSGSTDRVMG